MVFHSKHTKIIQENAFDMSSAKFRPFCFGLNNVLNKEIQGNKCEQFFEKIFDTPTQDAFLRSYLLLIQREAVRGTKTLDKQNIYRQLSEKIAVTPMC